MLGGYPYVPGEWSRFHSVHRVALFRQGKVPKAVEDDRSPRRYRASSSHGIVRQVLDCACRLALWKWAYRRHGARCHKRSFPPGNPHPQMLADLGSRPD